MSIYSQYFDDEGFEQSLVLLNLFNLLQKNSNNKMLSKPHIFISFPQFPINEFIKLVAKK